MYKNHSTRQVTSVLSGILPSLNFLTASFVVLIYAGMCEVFSVFFIFFLQIIDTQ